MEDNTADQRALPAPEQPDRPRGRHEAPRRSVGAPAGVAIATVVTAVVVAGVLATWLISSAKEAPKQSSAEAATTQAGPTSRPPGPQAFGNLVVKWSFEQDLSGWQAVGKADLSRRRPVNRLFHAGIILPLPASILMRPPVYRRRA